MDSHYIDLLLFGVLPYIALVLFFLVTIQRYRTQGFSYSSLSTQFLENKRHFGSVVPFHYGILVVLAGHIVAFFVPRSILLWNAHPLRLYILEVSALAFGVLTLVGLGAIIVRRVGEPKLRRVTTPADWVIYLLLGIQVASGVFVALFYPWGSSWFASSMTPYLWSIAKLSPEISHVVDVPWAVKLHIINAWCVIGFFPFTRLVHILVVPNPYLWRSPQVVRWFRTRGTGRGA
jgi:nitrate reductase gamma subunit